MMNTCFQKYMPLLIGTFSIFNVLTTHAFVVSPYVSAHPQHQHQKQYQERCSTFPLFAKKKKGGKNKDKKKSGFEWASSFSLKPFESKSGREFASSTVASFEGRTGKPLTSELKESTDIPKTLWNAPIACVVVGSPKSASGAGAKDKDGEGEVEKEEIDTGDLIIKYANIAALETIGLTPDQFERFIATTDDIGQTKLPEKDPVLITLPAVMKGDKNYESGYKKKIMKKGGDEDITIIDAYRWSIEKTNFVAGKFETETLGVAYAWSQWLLGESTVCSIGGGRKEQVDTPATEEAVQAQAAIIRELKEVQGFGNKDPEVMEAVSVLLRLKAVLKDSTE